MSSTDLLANRRLRVRIKTRAVAGQPTVAACRSAEVSRLPTKWAGGDLHPAFADPRVPTQWADGTLPHSGTLLAPGREVVRILIRTHPRLEPIAPAHEPAPRAAALDAPATAARREFLVLSGLAFLLLGCGIYATRAYVMDDALITLRYSFNLAHRGQAIWNQADAAHPSQGYTTVLWMLINAVPACFTENKDALVLCAKLLSVIPLAAVALLLVGPVSRMPVHFAYRAAVIGALFSQVAYGFHLNSGMETLLFSCLILLTVRTYARDDRSALAYAFGTLAFLTRPEGAIVVALMLVEDLRRGRTRQAAAGAMGFAAAALLLGLALYTTYGSVLPNAFYVKQTFASLLSVKHTFKFLQSVALPYLLLAAYSTYRLKDTASRYCWYVALVYCAYYLSVLPEMNVFSRYQWPVLVLLTAASLPAFQQLGVSGTRRRGLAAAALLVCALLNLRSGLAASYLAASAGTVQRNLIALGKAMAPHRDSRRWLAYFDAGAVCYYSDWNSYDTAGLNTRPIAVGSIQPTDVYHYPQTEIILQDCDDADAISVQRCGELRARLGRLGYHHAGSVPALTEGGQRRFLVLVFARSLARASAFLQGAQVVPEAPRLPRGLPAGRGAELSTFRPAFRPELP